MANCIFYIVFVLVIATLDQYLALSARSCRCLSNDPKCWPNSSAWHAFNASINGRLLQARSSAAPCTSGQYDGSLCRDTYTHWSDSTWRSDQVGAMQYFNWENSSCSIYNINSSCTQGSVPVYAVNATLPEHVQTTIQFVLTNNLRLVIKTTGHDLLGRSTAFGSLLLWLHYMKNMTLIPRYSVCGGANISNVVRLSAGVQWGDAYTWLAPYGLIILGGTSKSVAAAGGYIQGGGHSPLSRWGGIPTDQVLEYDVITGDGTRRTVSPCQHDDLFWALSGGGAGTYAVVLSVVLRTFSTPTMAGIIQSFEASNETRYALFIRDFFRILPSFADYGCSGYFTMADRKLSITLFSPNGNMTSINKTFTEFLNNYTDVSSTDSMIGVLPTFYDFYLYVLVGRDSTGYNGLVGSRLIPERIVRNQTDAVAQAFIQMKGQSAAFSSLTISMVGGGQASKILNINNSVNPLWRTALLHVFYGQAWGDDATMEQQQATIAQVSRHTKILDTLSDGSLLGCYMNEADPYEPQWQERFFGSQSLYDRLKTVKQKYDPSGLFVCKNCVGSDEWTTDLNCPKVSTTVNVRANLSLVLITILLLKLYLD